MSQEARSPALCYTCCQQRPLSFESTHIAHLFLQLVASTGLKMEASQLDLLRTDEMDIALRLSYLEHCAGPTSGSPGDDKEARRKEKKKQKDLKVPYLFVCRCLTCALWCARGWLASQCIERNLFCACFVDVIVCFVRCLKRCTLCGVRLTLRSHAEMHSTWGRGSTAAIEVHVDGTLRLCAYDRMPVVFVRWQAKRAIHVTVTFRTAPVAFQRAQSSVK